MVLLRCCYQRHCGDYGDQKYVSIERRRVHYFYLNSFPYIVLSFGIIHTRRSITSSHRIYFQLLWNVKRLEAFEYHPQFRSCTIFGS